MLTPKISTRGKVTTSTTKTTLIPAPKVTRKLVTTERATTKQVTKAVTKDQQKRAKNAEDLLRKAGLDPKTGKPKESRAPNKDGKALSDEDNNRIAKSEERSERAEARSLGYTHPDDIEYLRKQAHKNFDGDLQAAADDEFVKTNLNGLRPLATPKMRHLSRTDAVVRRAPANFRTSQKCPMQSLTSGSEKTALSINSLALWQTLTQVIDPGVTNFYDRRLLRKAFPRLIHALYGRRETSRRTIPPLLSSADIACSRQLRRRSPKA
jgi:hypothetical protein